MPTDVLPPPPSPRPPRIRVRWRVADLLAERNLTAHALSRLLGDRVSRTQIYRLTREDRPDAASLRVALDEIEALCEVLNVAPGDLFEARLLPSQAAG